MHLTGDFANLADSNSTSVLEKTVVEGEISATNDAVIETSSTLRQRAGREGSGGLSAHKSIGLSISMPKRLASELNGKRATAAVTRYGCWRGEFFGGCEPHCAEWWNISIDVSFG